MTLHYHGTPITPLTALRRLEGRLFCVSYARPEQVKHVHAIGQSVMLDNGAFSMWRRGKPTDWPGYYRWTEKWLVVQTTWAVIPDVIDGSEDENDALIDEWPHGDRGVPVWHLNESLSRLLQLALVWPMICFGSSGEYGRVGTQKWHDRIAQAFDIITIGGVPVTRVHMLRGMAQAGGRYPFYSLDSTDVARNHNRSQNESGDMGFRWDRQQCSPLWTAGDEWLEQINQTFLS